MAAGDEGTRVILPALGEAVAEGTIDRWLVSVGDRVQLYQALCEIATDKVNAELPSPVTGVVRQILVPAGATAACGAVLCVIGPEVGDAPGAPQAAEPPAVEPAVAPPAQATSGPPELPGPQRQAAVQGQPAAQHSPVEPPSAMRRAIAGRLSQSWRDAPHAWMLVECDLTGLVALRRAERAAFEAREGVPLTYLPFFVKAVVAGLRAEPTLNASWGEAGIRRHEQLGLGIAVALDEGLVVPVLRGAGGLSIAGLARALHELVTRARSGRLLTADLEGGTFTVNNTGVLGSIASAPIINPPQAGIVTLEAIVPRPAVVGEGIAIRQQANLCLSYDHRMADGLNAARFLRAVRQALEAYREGDPLY